MLVQLRYFAAAKAAVGRASETLEVPEGVTIAELIELIELRDRTDAALAAGRRVLARCSFIRNGVSGTDTAQRLADGDRLDLLPPFAGG